MGLASQNRDALLPILGKEQSLRQVAAMRWDLDLIQWQVIKFGGVVVVALIVFIHIVKLVKEVIAEVRKTPRRRARNINSG
jgi:hypothetical protein